MTRCGFIALLGRPNVGKSTLMNYLVGEKISITSNKPQTTRTRMLGIRTQDTSQMIFVDTPGVHQDTPRAINRYMNRSAKSALADINVVAWLVEALQWRDDDQLVLELLKTIDTPIILVINKIDKVPDKKQLLPWIQDIEKKLNFKAIVPLSALKQKNLASLEKALIDLLPESPFYFEQNQVTDKSLKFMVAELIREKCFRLTSQELPYSLTIEIEKFTVEKNIRHISGLIYVEREGQKKIIIGKQGDKLKQIGTQARQAIENLLNQKVFLKLWVKVKSGWGNDAQALQSLGYDDD